MRERERERERERGGRERERDGEGEGRERNKKKRGGDIVRERALTFEAGNYAGIYCRDLSRGAIVLHAGICIPRKRARLSIVLMVRSRGPLTINIAV